MIQKKVKARRHKAIAAAIALRPHQWSKNLLVVAPLFLAHEAGDPDRLTSALAAFVCFCLMASAIYLINDILDIDRDRAHPYKCNRPIAAGEISPSEASILAVLLAFTSLGLAILLTPLSFLFVLVVYLTITVAYSAVLKSLLLIDVACLTLLYNLRLIGGGAAVEVPLSPWLLGLSLFLFTSLALAKRYTEVGMASGEQDLATRHDTFGRAYQPSDLPFLGVAGTSAGIVSALVLSLYVTGDTMALQYTRPEYLWFTAFLLLFWILRVWISAYRGQLHSDPIVFAFKDKPSLIMGVSIVICFFLAY